MRFPVAQIAAAALPRGGGSFEISDEGLRMRGNSWPDEAVAKMRALYADGHSAGEIAKALNDEFRLTFTRNMVCGKLFRLSQDPPPPRAPREAKAVAVVAPKKSRATANESNSLIAREKSRRALEREQAASYKRLAAVRQKLIVEEAFAKRATDDVFSPVAGSAPVSLVDLPVIGACRWPIGEPRELDDFRLCGGAVGLRADGSPSVYCATYHALAYQPLTRVKRAPDNPFSVRPWGKGRDAVAVAEGV